MLLEMLESWRNWVAVLSASWYNTVKDVVVKVISVIALFLTLMWLSVFLYGSFYYSYMPSIMHIQDVNFHYSADCHQDKYCPFPSANLSMVKENKVELLMRGQKYRIQLDLEMPESPINQNLGMFMVLVQFYSRYGEVVQSGSRATMLRFKSALLQTMETLFFSPFLIFGAKQQKQTVTVDLMEKYLDDPYKPTLGIFVELQQRKVEIYSATLKVYTHFTGLRFLIYKYPVLAAVLGIGTNMVFLCTVALLSWYQFLTSDSDTQDVVQVGQDPEKGSEPQMSSLTEIQKPGLKVVSSRPLRTASTGSLTGTGRLDTSSTDPGHTTKTPQRSTSPTKASLETTDDAASDEGPKEEESTHEESFRSLEGEAQVEDVGLRFRTTAQQLK